MPATPDSSHPETEAERWWSFANLVRPRIFTYWHAAAWLILAVTAFRFWYATQQELVGDEAYYWLWSKNLDISYFSKGPGVAWTIALGRTLWGDTVFGVRFFAVLLSAGTGSMVFLLARRLFSGRTAYWSLITLLAVPLYSLGSVLMTIDALSVFFWAAASLSFWRAKDSGKRGLWVLTGLLVGLGMLCKYTNVAQLICFGLFCACFADQRRHLKKTFWIMTAVALVCLAPVLLWNSRHDWVTFEHLWHRGSLDRAWRFSPQECLQFLTGQALVLTPFLAAGLVAAVVWTFRHAHATAHRKELAYLLCLTLPLFAFYTFLSFNESGEANWTSQCWASGIILLVAVWQPWMDRSAVLRRLAQAGLALALLATVLFHLASLAPPSGFRPLDKLFARNRGSADLARQVSEIQQQYGATFIIANKYPTVSLLSFYLPGRPRTYLPNDPQRRNQFTYWPDYTDGFLHESALFVTDSTEFPPALHRDFASVELLKETHSIHRGAPVHSYRIYLLREFGSGPSKPNQP